jgi:predicted nucleotide-binding protein
MKPPLFRPPEMITTSVSSEGGEEMSKRPSVEERPGPALLARSREEARGQILDRVLKASSITAGLATSSEGLEVARSRYDRWNAYNEELIRRMFTNHEHFYAYREAYTGIGIDFHRDVANKWRVFVQLLEKKENFLIGLAERIELIGEDLQALSGTGDLSLPSATKSPENKKIFLVHGQNEEAKSVVARFIEKCKLEPIILHEQVDLGRTIIEKFEQEADVGFAVILLTPDDVGGLAKAGDTPSSKALKHRARQNVILELGYFIGRLGRARVCALRKGEVELPSDFSGVIYTPLGAEGAWKMKLGMELRAAGYDVDLNAALA